ncbi:unnamed protein product, partial [Ilex paraguariensis]
MLTLNLFPTSSVTFSRSGYKYPINDSLLGQKLVNENQNQRTPHVPSLPLNKHISHLNEPRLSSSFINIHGYSLGSFSNPTSHISNLNIFGHQVGFSSKPTSNIPQAASRTSQEANPNGEIEVSKSNKSLQLLVIFGLWYFQNIVFNIYNKK